jgi:hypothetical protein
MVVVDSKRPTITMKDLSFNLFALCFLLFIAGCNSGSEYSEEEQKTLIKAEKTHYLALDEYADAMENLDIITTLEDSITLRTNEIGRYMDIEGTNTDSLQTLSTKFSQTQEELSSARNALLEWTDNIYGLQDIETVYSQDESSREKGIAKDTDSDMLRNEITYKELPPDISPEELLALQEEQLAEIQKIHQQIQDAVERTITLIAENQ